MLKKPSMGAWCVGFVVVVLGVFAAGGKARADWGNGKVEFRTPTFGQPRVEVRITDPDGIDEYTIYQLKDDGTRVAEVTGRADCAGTVTETLSGSEHLSHSHVVVYDDCQEDPARETWTAHAYFSIWTKGTREEASFVRGDVNQDGSVDISDGIIGFSFLFLGGPAPECEDSMDVDDSGTMNITDPIYLLNHLFLDGPGPAFPYPVAGSDPTLDPLSCLYYAPLDVPTTGGNHSSLSDLVLWTSARDGSYEIFRMHSDGSERWQLTDDPSTVVNQHPVFSVDGRRVLWNRNNAIWSMRVDGGDKVQLTSSDEGDASHPWDGVDGRIYFVRHVDHVHTIWSMNRDGSDQVRVVPPPGQPIEHEALHANLHPNGQVLVYTASPKGQELGRQVRLFFLESQDDIVLFEPGWPVSGALWHPRGDRLVLSEDPDGDGHYRLAEISVPHGHRISVLTSDSLDHTIPYYSYPAGDQINWVLGRGGRHVRDIYRMDADGSNVLNLTRSPYEDTKIVGDIESEVASTALPCLLPPVGWNPNPPPCAFPEMERDMRASVQALGLWVGDRDFGKPRDLTDGEFNAFFAEELEKNLKNTELSQLAFFIFERLVDRDRFQLAYLSDIFVNSYYINATPR